MARRDRGSGSDEKLTREVLEALANRDAHLVPLLERVQALRQGNPWPGWAGLERALELALEHGDDVRAWPFAALLRSPIRMRDRDSSCRSDASSPPRSEREREPLASCGSLRETHSSG
jgi:hypothetical protein